MKTYVNITLTNQMSFEHPSNEVKSFILEKVSKVSLLRLLFPEFDPGNG